MNYYYITGTSRGLGKAFAEHLLDDPSNYVIGISRKRSIEHKNYTHINLDLSDANALTQFKFELHADAKKIYLINNAGVMSFIKPVGKLEASSIINDFTVNLIAPAILSNSFIKCYELTDAEKVIVNISSGAGKNPIDGWAIYCASKAGLDMLSEVIDAEQKIQSIQLTHKKVHIFSIAPGIVDTSMQDAIRAVRKEDFSRVEEFKAYKAENKLSEPAEVSEKYIEILSNINTIKEVISSVRDY